MNQLFQSNRLLKFTAILLAIVIAFVGFWQYHNSVSIEASGVVSVDIGPGVPLKTGDEIVAERTETAKKFYLGGSSYAVEASLSAIHYKDDYTDAQEQWKDIDLTFTNSEITKAPYILAVDTDNQQITVQDKKTGKTATIRLTKVGQTAQKSLVKNTPKVEKGEITWKDVDKDLDLAISASNTRVSFDWVVKSENAPHQVEFEIKDGGLPIIYEGKDAEGQPVEVAVTKDGSRVIETIQKGGKYPKVINPVINDVTWEVDDDGYCSSTWFMPDGNMDVVGNSTFHGGVCHDWYLWYGFTIPANATIGSNSYVTMDCTGDGNGSPMTRVYFEKQSSPDYPTSYTDYMSKSLTTNYVNWNLASWHSGYLYSPSIQNIIQELVNTFGQITTLQCLNKDNGSSANNYLWTYLDVGRVHIEYTAPATISNTPSSYNFGVVETASTLATGLNYFSITNNSGSAVNITIGGSDLSGGTGWTLSDTATPGATSYGLKAGLNGGAYNIVVKKTPPFNTLKSNLSNSSSQGWGLQILAPTSNTDITQKEGSIILTATLY